MEKQPFGSYIRQLREEKEMPLRKLAAALDIDTSTLSKIERQERHAVPAMIPVIADIFSLEYRDLQVRFWTDKLINEIGNEAFITDALKNIVDILESKKDSESL